MQLGGIYIWTYTYSLMKRTVVDYDSVPDITGKEGEEEVLPRSISNLVEEAQVSQSVSTSNNIALYVDVLVYMITKGIEEELCIELTSPSCHADATTSI